jgi:hypothetical protein
MEEKEFNVTVEFTVYVTKKVKAKSAQEASDAFYDEAELSINKAEGVEYDVNQIDAEVD